MRECGGALDGSFTPCGLPFHRAWSAPPHPQITPPAFRPPARARLLERYSRGSLRLPCKTSRAGGGAPPVLLLRVTGNMATQDRTRGLHGGTARTVEHRSQRWRRRCSSVISASNPSASPISSSAVTRSTSARDSRRKASGPSPSGPRLCADQHGSGLTTSASGLATYAPAGCCHGAKPAAVPALPPQTSAATVVGPGPRSESLRRGAQPPASRSSPRRSASCDTPCGGCAGGARKRVSASATLPPARRSCASTSARPSCAVHSAAYERPDPRGELGPTRRRRRAEDQAECRKQRGCTGV